MLRLDLPLDERAARTDLRAQIATLEARLVQSAPVPGPVHAPARGPALQSFAALAATRDDLLARVAAAERTARERGAREAAARELLAAMQAAPAAHRGTVLTLAALGEPGCGAYRVRPRLGLIGRFAGWWQLTLSSGCPLRAS